MLDSPVADHPTVFISEFDRWPKLSWKRSSLVVQVLFPVSQRNETHLWHHLMYAANQVILMFALLFAAPFVKRIVIHSSFLIGRQIVRYFPWGGLKSVFQHEIALDVRERRDEMEFFQFVSQHVDQVYSCSTLSSGAIRQHVAASDLDRHVAVHDIDIPISDCVSQSFTVPPRINRPNAPTILWPHGFEKDKNYEYLLEAAEAMGDRASFIVAGRTRAEGLELPKNVHVAGRLNRKQYFELLQQVDCVLIASKREGKPRSAIEAVCAGVPVLAPEYIATELEFPIALPDDPSDLGQALDQALRADFPQDRIRNRFDPKRVYAHMVEVGYVLT